MFYICKDNIMDQNKIYKKFFSRIKLHEIVVIGQVQLESSKINHESDRFSAKICCFSVCFYSSNLSTSPHCLSPPSPVAIFFLGLLSVNSCPIWFWDFLSRSSLVQSATSVSPTSLDGFFSHSSLVQSTRDYVRIFKQ